MESSHIVGSFSFLFSLIIGLDNGLMFSIFGSAWTGPSTSEAAALTFLSVTSFSSAVVFLEGMFAETLEIIGAVGGNVLIALAFALTGCAGLFLVLAVHVVVIFELMVTKALRFRTYHLTVNSHRVLPTQVKSILALFAYRQTYWLSDVHLTELFRWQVHTVSSLNNYYYYW